MKTVRAIYDAWNGPDPVSGVLPHLDPEFEWIDPDHGARDDRRGHDAWAAGHAFLEASYDRFEHEPGGFLSRGDRVLCYTTLKARRRDEAGALERSEPHVWTLRDGSVTRLQSFRDETEAREAIGIARREPRQRPLIVVVDPDPALGAATEGDLRRAFDDGFDVMRLESAAATLELLADRRDRGEQVALLVADQELGEMTGCQLASRSRELFDFLKTIVFIRYPEMSTALDGINAGTLDYYFVKPLAPDGRQLLPVASDLLADWTRRRDHARSSVQVVADPRSGEAQPLRDFLASNDIQYRLVDPASSEGRALLEGSDSPATPMVVLAGGELLERPSPLSLAQGLGLPTVALESSYDVVIVGGGPAGLAGAVYAASEGLRTIVLERLAPGGQAGQSAKIENYLGFPGGLTGTDLAQRAIRQCRRFNAEIVRLQDAVGLTVDGETRIVQLRGGNTLQARAVLLASGAAYRRLEAPGIEPLLGKGVYYGAGASEADEFAGLDVLVVGGGNSAGQAALHLARYARKVSMLVREGSLEQGMSRYLIERIASTPNMDVELQTTVTRAFGDDRLDQVEVHRASSGEQHRIRASALFISIGALPDTGWLSGTLALDDHGYILTGPEVTESPAAGPWRLDREPYLLEASIPGVFAAGDVRHGSTKRVASAVGDGAMSVQLIHRYLRELDSSAADAA